MPLPSAGERRRHHVIAALTACAALVLAMGGLVAINAIQNPVQVSVLAAGEVATPQAESAQIVDAESVENSEAHEHDPGVAAHAHDEGESDAAHAHDDATGTAHAHDDSDAAHDDSGTAHGHDGATGATHDDSAPHGHDAATGATHDDSAPHGHDAATGATHDDSAPHGHGPTVPGSPPVTHGNDHPHDPGPTVPGETTPTTHGNDHPHDPGPTVPGETTPTTHGNDHPHDPGPTVPGDTTPTTHGNQHPHDGPNVQLSDLPADIQAQITAVTNWAMQYPTVAQRHPDFPRLTSYFPGIAAHFVHTGRLFDNKPFDPTEPEVLLYNGTGPNAKLVGINYIVRSGDNPPEGFPGDYDGWHEHATLCLSGGIVVGEVPNGEACPSGQSPFPFDGFWLLHVWSIPGWEAPEGIFAHANSRV